MKIGILGGGESGVGATLLAVQKGHQPFVSDYGRIKLALKEELNQHNIRFEEGGHSFEILERQDLIIKSPGIAPTAPIIKHLRQKGVKIIGEIEFAYTNCEGKIIAITGTNGKTTTTNLTHHFLHAASYKVQKGGNLGRSFSRMVMEGYDWYVVEVSSFQLEDIITFRPHIAALLNISPDHLDRYDESMSKYLAAKCRIFMNQGSKDVAFVPSDDRIRACAKKNKAEVIVIEEDGVSEKWQTKNPFLNGAHNRLNLEFAAQMADKAGVSKNVIDKAVDTFVNDDHRLQPIARINGVLYINDSKATNVDSVQYALRAFDQPIIWIVGGMDKGNDYSLIAKDVKQNVDHIIALGLDNQKILEYFNGMVKSISEARSMREAILLSRDVAKAGNVVLLSPACASFDLFNHYKDRGDQFKNEVWQLLRANKKKE